MHTFVGGNFQLKGVEEANNDYLTIFQAESNSGSTEYWINGYGIPNDVFTEEAATTVVWVNKKDSSTHPTFKVNKISSAEALRLHSNPWYFLEVIGRLLLVCSPCCICIAVAIIADNRFRGSSSDNDFSAL